MWADAVRVHQPNTFDASAAGVAAWSPAQLTDLQIELTNLLVLMEHPQQRQFWLQDARRNLITILYNDGEVDSLRQLARSVGGRDPVAPDTEQERRRVAAARARLLDRGAILHTDIARLSTPGAAPDAAPGNARRNPTSGSGVIEFYDGQVIGVFRSSNQWTVARDLLDRATRTPSRAPEVRLWYQATLTWMLGTMQLNWPQFQRAQQLFPNDPELLYLQGCLHETLASSRVQHIINSMTRIEDETTVRSGRAELESAEPLLKRALKADPSLTEARLRLGRVESLRGNQSSAAMDLRKVVSSSTDPILLYYANLFLGSGLDALGDRDGAKAAYERASAFFPRAGAPRLALSQLAVRSGDREGALARLDPVLRDGGADDRDDPWLRYYVAERRAADTRLTAAYQALLNGTTP